MRPRRTRFGICGRRRRRTSGTGGAARRPTRIAPYAAHDAALERQHRAAPERDHQAPAFHEFLDFIQSRPADAAGDVVGLCREYRNSATAPIS